MNEIQTAVIKFNDECVKIIKQKAEIMNFDIDRYVNGEDSLIFSIKHNIFTTWDFKFNYGRIFKIEEPNNWLNLTSFTNTSEKNVKFICKHGEEILQKLLEAIEKKILKLHKEEIKVAEKAKKRHELDKRCSKKIQDML